MTVATAVTSTASASVNANGTFKLSYKNAAQYVTVTLNGGTLSLDSAVGTVLAPERLPTDGT